MKENAYGLRWNRDIDPEKAYILCEGSIPFLMEVKGYEITKEESGPDQADAFRDEVDSPTHVLIKGDNLHSLAILCYTHAGKIHLIIIDPTYNTGNPKKDVAGRFMYNDKYVDKDDPDRHSKYLSVIEKRLKEAKILLHELGSIFIMTDHHELKNIWHLCDQIFGEENFRNCVTWNYGGRGAKSVSGQLPRNCDYILWYSKSDKVIYNKIYAEEIIDKKHAPLKGYKLDADGRWFYTSPRGDYTDESINRLRAENRIYETRNGNIRIKYFLEERDNKIINKKLIGNVWDDIPDAMHMSARERVGFATQKPMKLFRRMVEMASNRDSIVLDFFAGSGTTGHAVLDLNKEDGGKRQFILCEIDQNIIDEKTYPRIKNNMKELGGTLKYFEVDFIGRVNNSHELAQNVATTCSGVLRVKENNYNELENNGAYEVYYQDADSLLAIYKKDYNLDPMDDQLMELKDILNGLDCDNKTLYVFSTDEYVEIEDEFEDWDGVEVKLMPFDIINTYKRVFDYELKV